MPLNGLTFAEYCANLNIQPHEFNGPILRGECIDCGLRASEHNMTTPTLEPNVKRDESIMEQAAPVIQNTPATCPVDRKPRFKVVAQMSGVEPLATTWMEKEQASQAYRMIAGTTSLEIKVIMRVCDVEIDLFEVASFFAKVDHAESGQ